MELPNRDQLEASFAARVSRLTTKHRQQLLTLLGNPPDPANVPESFWSEAEDDMKRELAIILLLIFSASAARHGMAADASAAQANSFALQRSSLVAAGYRAKSREQFQTTSQRWTETTTRGGTVTRQQVADDVTSIFGPTRAEGIATTETTVAQSAGGEIAVAGTFGLSALDTWFTRDDNRVCPICAPLHEVNRDVWAVKFPNGPPAHPRCRCWILYANVPAEAQS